MRSFVNVVHLSLRGNRIASLARVIGLPDLKNLLTLNVQHNALTSLEDVARLITLMPLRAIGLAENPLAEVKLYRAKLIALLPALADGKCALRSIDDIPILPGA